MTFTSPEERNLNLASIFLAFLEVLACGCCYAKVFRAQRLPGVGDFETRPSDDEKRLLKKSRAGEITQTYALIELSKAKVSAILCA